MASKRKVTIVALDSEAHLGRFVAAGAEHVVVRLAAPDLAGQHDQLERLAAVAPQLAFAFT